MLLQLNRPSRLREPPENPKFLIPEPRWPTTTAIAAAVKPGDGPAQTICAVAKSRRVRKATRNTIDVENQNVVERARSPVDGARDGGAIIGQSQTAQGNRPAKTTITIATIRRGEGRNTNHCDQGRKK